jgi:hypothetical protein
VTRRERHEAPVELLEGLRGPLPIAERSSDEQRHMAIEAIARRIRGEGDALRRTRTFAMCGAAAVVLLGVAVLWMVEHRRPVPDARVAVAQARAGSELRVTAGVVVTTRNAVPTAIAPGSTARIEPGDEIRSATDGEAELSLPRGVRVGIGRSTKTALRTASELEQRLRLDLGKTTVSVPRPGGPREFAIDTPDTQVIVHGTEFSVHVEQDGAGATFTRVSVTRGAVLVVHAGEQRLIESGNDWSSLGITPGAGASNVDISGQAIVRAPPASARVPSGDARARDARGALAEQNRLFRAALEARKAGDDSQAVEYLSELLSRFPKGVLTQDARLARQRALERLGRDPRSTDR